MGGGLEAFYHSLIRGRRGRTADLLRAGLWVCSQPYGWAVRGRNWLFERGWKRSFAADVPVVSVGNLTVGGTGKTPCVEYVARFFRRQNLRVAILSRGYGGRGTANDEARMLRENLPDVPHLQGADRVSLAQLAVQEQGSEILVLDDGFQHRRLRRDLDLVLIDATSPWGHGYLLPRGLLREPRNGLRRGHMFLLTRCDQAEPEELRRLHAQIEEIAPALPIIETTHRPARWINAVGRKLPLTELLDRPWAGFCGIGNPESFRRSLLRLGGHLCDWRTFPDHHEYGPDTVEELRRWAERQPADCVIVTTQKDLVKVADETLSGREVWALQVQFHIETQARVFEEKLLSVIRPTDCETAFPGRPSYAEQQRTA
jgi:tetraacyldisaccharide 4'-kinase